MNFKRSKLIKIIGIIITLLLIVYIFIFFIQAKSKIYYEYNGVVITRVDYNSKAYFYYGKYEDNNFPNSFIEVEFDRINIDGGFEGYIIFNKDKTVDILISDGYDVGIVKKRKIGNESKFRIGDESIWSRISDTIQAKKLDYCFVNFLSDVEKEINIEYSPQIKIEYIYFNSNSFMDILKSPKRL